MEPVNLGEGSGPPLSFIPFETSDDFRADQVGDALSHIRSCLARGLPEFRPEPQQGGRLVIVGGGPSMAEHIDAIRALNVPGNRIVALNDAHNFLLDHGIVPWGMAFMEVERWQPAFMLRAREGVKYLLASHCHPTSFDALEGRDVVVWHCFSEIGEADILSGRLLIAGGCSALLRSINLGLMMGFRRFEMFGADSSYRERSHAYYDRRDIPDLEVWCAGKRFVTNAYLARQARDFTRLLRAWGHLFQIRVHGDGLLPWIASHMLKEPA